MFGRKSNQIKALKQTLEIKERTLINRFELLKLNQEEINTLKLERETLKARNEELEAGLKFANQTNRELQEKLEASTGISDEA